MNKICSFFGHKFPQALPEGLEPGYNDVPCTRKNCHEEVHVHYRDTLLEYQTRVSNRKFENTFWDSDMWGAIKTIASILGVAGAIMVFLYIFLTVPSVISQKVQCDVYEKQGIDVMWNFWTGCMANHPYFGWLPIQEYFHSLNIFVP